MDYSILKREWKKIFSILYLSILVIAPSYYMIKEARLNDYMGDEVWYVPATRNMLNMLGIRTHYIDNNSTGVNIFLKEPLYVGKVVINIYGIKIEKSVREYPKIPELVRKLGINIEYLPFNYTKNESYWENLKLKIWEIAERNGFLEYETYSKFPGVYYVIPVENYERFMKELSNFSDIVVVPGYKYPDEENIHKYLNTEHPFLGKDLIALGMLANDKPLYWRLPGIIEHALIVLIVAFVSYKIARSYLATLISATFVALDPLLFATGIVAMLDIHVAFFVALFMLFLTIRRLRISGISLGLAAATKLSGAFVFPILWAKILKEEDLKEFIISGVVLPVIAFLVPEIPIIKAIGFIPWLEEFMGSFSWHLSFKGEHPAEAPFWLWFISLKPFPFHFNPDVYAVTDPILMISMIAFIFAVPYVSLRRKGLGEIFWMFWSIIGFFALQYILGGKTQFIFYATPLVPPGAVALGVISYEIIKWEYFERSVKIYMNYLRSLKEFIKR
ncbi:TPA: dolichyl-phosphate-mannose--protein mannosyltransferase [Pyrococcus horikoshii]|nr:dolichyl-phosphate-mannose--protein mannosyltransferase [Pyrococcus horikoshii]HII60621.1 dolichyl-phosphate-mannose--protein mannosyltransferase [Pyrococcus horikoshii]